MSNDRASAPIAPTDAAAVRGWHDRADVVVVGLGCAGACAAIEASALGADVLVLEATDPVDGGTSALSGGIVYMGGGTPVQASCGFEDSPENMAVFLEAACGPDADTRKIEAYSEGSVGHYHWLVEHGVPFVASYHPEHDREPPDESGLVYSGGEDSWPFSAIATPAPRGHHPRYPDRAGGFLMDRLLGGVAAARARVVGGARVERLVVDHGAVVGAVARVGGEELVVRARRGVVLTTGGFMMNRAMVEELCPVALRCNWPIGTDRDDGRGIRIALGAGAATVGLERVEVGMPLTPPRSIVRGILVNGRGARFINEDTYSGRIGQEILLRQDGAAFFVHDDETFAVNLVGSKPAWVAETPGELEAEIGLPPGSLASTLDRYNDDAARREDTEHHKAPEWLKPLVPPYGVVDLRVEHAIYAPFTLGGVHTDVDARVLDRNGGAIPGLFAAGRTAAGVAAGGYVSGISLGDGTFFGRRAGRSAAGRPPRTSAASP
jgi:3-oxo-5alpha-steroid 4-dehydrogenase